MATASTPSINHGLTSLSGITGGGGTTTTDLATVGDGAPSTTTSLPIASGVTVNSPRVSLPTEGATESLLSSSTSQIAVLTQSDTTLTAYAVPGTTGLAVLEGSTISFRGEGVTLSDGNVVSLGFNGLVESTATGTYQTMTGSDTPATLTTSQSQGGSESTPAGTSGEAPTEGSGGATQASASASPSESADAAASLSAGKAAMLLGAVGGVVVMGL